MAGFKMHLQIYEGKSASDEFGSIDMYFDQLTQGANPYVAKLIVKENTSPDSKYKYSLGRYFFDLNMDWSTSKTRKMYGDFTVKVGDIIEVRGAYKGNWGQHLFLITGKELEDGTIDGDYVYLGDWDNCTDKHRKIMFAKIMKYLTNQITVRELYSEIGAEERKLIEKVKSMQSENETVKEEKPSENTVENESGITL